MKKQVNICKNLTDVFAFLACFFAVIAVLVFKNEFEPTEEITSFRELEKTKNYAILACAFLFSALVNSIFRKIPTLCFAVSLIPVWITYYYFTEKQLVRHPMVYVLLALIHAVGALIYFVQWYENSEHMKRNCNVCTASALSLAGISLILWGVSRFALTVRYELMVKPLFYMFLVCGIFFGLAGMVWSHKAKLKEPLATKAEMLRALSSALVCLIILMLRYNIATFGF